MICAASLPGFYEIVRGLLFFGLEFFIRTQGACGVFADQFFGMVKRNLDIDMGRKPDACDFGMLEQAQFNKTVIVGFKA